MSIARDLAAVRPSKGAGSVATNTAVGASALAANTTGFSSVAVGNSALLAQTTGDRNVAVGDSVLSTNTTGVRNTGIGHVALAANSTGSYNTAHGAYALFANTTASNNTAVGYQAGYSGTTANSNTAVGYQSFYSITTGSLSTAIGHSAGYSNTTGDRNTFIGAYAGYNVTTGTGNVFVGGVSSGNGNGAGRAVTTGSKNTILGTYDGNQGGLDIRTASNYIVLSDGDGNPRMYFNGAVATIGFSGSGQIESYISATSARTNHYNDAGATRGCQFFYYGGVEKGSITISSTATAYVTSSDYRLKNSVAPMTGALAKVAALKPCTYKWNSDGSDGQGFIAHELQAVVPQCVTGEKDAVDEDGNPQYQGIDTSFLVATLTAAIQELKAEFDAYKATHP